MKEAMNSNTKAKFCNKHSYAATNSTAKEESQEATHRSAGRQGTPGRYEQPATRTPFESPASLGDARQFFSDQVSDDAKQIGSEASQTFGELPRGRWLREYRLEQRMRGRERRERGGG